MTAPTITWSETNEGTAITDPLDHGTEPAGDTTTVKDIYVRHDGSNQLTQCKFWIGEYSGTYTGGASASLDLAEILAWGDDTDAADFGGFFISMDAAGSFPTWPTLSDKNTSTYAVFQTGIGDSADDGLALATDMSTVMSTAGVIPADGSHDPNPHFEAKIQIPTSEATAGIRQFDQKLRFTYTS